jgi:hypothetical protein
MDIQVRRDRPLETGSRPNRASRKKSRIEAEMKVKVEEAMKRDIKSCAPDTDLAAIRAVARPMPDVAPVITIVCSLNLLSRTFIVQVPAVLTRVVPAVSSLVGALELTRN